MSTKRTLRFTAAVMALIICALSFSPAIPAFAQNTPSAPGQAAGGRTVRVGLPDADTAGESGGENRMVAFEKDYLQALSEYAGWNFVYVSATWGECLEMVKTGKIDMLPYVSMTDERLKYYDYSSQPMATEMCYLLGREDTKLRYDDYASFDGMTVGFEDGSTVLYSLQERARQAGVALHTRAYKSGAAMFAALDAGEVDAVVQTNFYDTPEGHVILSKFSPSPVYIVTAKTDPTLKTELDNAMAQLFSYNPGFGSDLFDYHFGNAVSQSVGYTQQETEYLARHPVVNVYYETDWTPFEYDRSGEAAGITPDIIRAIAQDTGIAFHFILTSSTKDVYEGVGGETKDAVMAVSYDYGWANSHDLLVTQPYVSGSVLRVMKNSAAAPKSVAVVKDGYIESRIKETYPELRAVEYLTFSQCMDAVAGGRADCTFLNYYQANYYRSMKAYEDYSYQPDGSISQGISLGVTKGSDPALFSILSKSLQRISVNTVQGILSENSAQTEALTLHLLLRRYPVQLALSLGLLGTLVGLLAILLVSAGSRNRQNLQLAAAIRQADAANRSKSEFLSRMSHDMRTPLNGIIGMTYLTEKLELPEAARENLAKIDTSSRFLLNLINDLLDMTKAESGKIELHPEPYPPEEFEQYIDAVIRPLCENKNQLLTSRIDWPQGYVPLQDKLRINQIVFNLLSNAVKYTPEGGSITYICRANVLPNGRISMHIQVADSGIGMSREFQKVLFTPFTQENRSDISESRGSGLGLAITKQLVDLMGGTIAVDSQIGRGSILTVCLETDCIRDDTGVKAEHGRIADDTTLLAGKHILLCEDHPLNQEIAKALLTDKMMTVEIADDGQRGVNAFSRSSVGYYDAVLMDIRMPVMDGYRAAAAIRALNRPDAGTVPIIAMTADVFADDIQKCAEVGMNGHIPKPIDPQVMYRELIKAVSGSKAII